jgi:hypothetical protein
VQHRHRAGSCRLAGGAAARRPFLDLPGLPAGARIQARALVGDGATDPSPRVTEPPVRRPDGAAIELAVPATSITAVVVGPAE